MPEPMDVEKVLDGLNKAICLQAQSMVHMSLLAGSLRGMGALATKEQLRAFVLAETEDMVKLTEKASALGGSPVADLGRIEVDSDPRTALPALLQHEQEAIEHLLEHLIMRKQQQVDFLWHASDLDEPLEPVDTD